MVSWTNTFAELERWREERQLTKANVAKMLYVSVSTYHRWAQGSTVAPPGTQKRARELMAHAPNWATVGATAEIVESYILAHGEPMAPESIVDLTRQVRQALSGAELLQT